MCCRCQTFGDAIRSLGRCPAGCPVCPRHQELLHQADWEAFYQQAIAEQQAEQEHLLVELEQQQSQQTWDDLDTQEKLDLLRQQQMTMIKFAQHKVTEAVYKDRLAVHTKDVQAAFLDCTWAESLFIPSAPDN